MLILVFTRMLVAVMASATRGKLWEVRNFYYPR